MRSFRNFLKENALTSRDVEDVLGNMGYTIKPTKVKSRLAVVTDKRSDAISKILNAFDGAKLSKTKRDLNISSLGIINVGSVEIIVKPASKNVLKAEKDATESLIKVIRQAVEQEGRPIDILIGKYVIKSAVTAGSDQIRGDPKADIAIIDDAGREVGFISHKKEGGAKAYQQYGGITEKAGTAIYNDPLVKNFVLDIEKYVRATVGGSEAKSGNSFWRYIPQTTGELLVARSIYGPKWNGGGASTFGRDSVHCIGQGSPILTRNTNGSYTLSFSETMHTADDVSWAFSGDYKAVLAATYRSGRKIEHGNSVVMNLRGGIYPYDFVKSRRAQEI